MERTRNATPRRNPLLAPVVALALLAAGGAGWAGWAGWSWYAAAHDDSAAYAKTRDEVLAAGEQAVQNMNTLDHRDLRRGLDTWQDSATGELRAQLTEGRARFEQQIREARTVTSAKVLSGAVTELDTRAGRARVMVALRITVTPSEGKPTAKQSRLLGELTRTPEGWKLSALGQAPVGSTAAERVD
ncbi:nuclear transport factor 2 family protein [Streptomyces sp. NPDC006307]|uniref:nuclear transport factor 2 family protein n=1 Tax=Streptomyces sp. NPDC006307 TaxID=3156748 RepID=UPI0033B79A48